MLNLTHEQFSAAAQLLEATTICYKEFGPGGLVFGIDYSGQRYSAALKEIKELKQKLLIAERSAESWERDAKIHAQNSADKDVIIANLRDTSSNLVFNTLIDYLKTNKPE